MAAPVANTRSAPEISGRIVFDPHVCGGRPHTRGGRVRVGDVRAALARGESVADILTDFPYLDEEDIRAALQHAAGSVDHLVLTAA